MSRKKDKEQPILENIEILDAGSEGNCIAKQDGMVIFVPYLVPGDRADLQILKKKKNFAQAKAVRITKFSDKRTEKLCPHFTICGGCKWQEMLYSEQIKYKEKQVLDALQHIGGVSTSCAQPILGSQKTKEYRNKLEFSFSSKRWITDQEVQSSEFIENNGGVGFHAPSSFCKVVDVTYCALQEEPSNEIRNFVRDYTRTHSLSYYDTKTHEGLMRSMVCRTTQQGQIMLIVVFAYKSDEIEPLLNAIADKFPQITSLMYCINTKLNDSLGDQQMLLFKGQEYIYEYMEAFDKDSESLKFKIGPKSFFQTNTLQAQRLYNEAAKLANLQKDALVYDLYTGCGTIANYIAKSVKQVIGIEYIEEAITDAKENSQVNNITNTVFYAGDMAKVFNNDFVKANGKPDIIITDPPRAGMAPLVIEQLLALEANQIVYISCNPATQARDIKLLSEKYNITAIQPVDMFPHTQHVENIISLTKK
jgi:23S rRNA (uracil-5-)-methyltransferase RumA